MWRIIACTLVLVGFSLPVVAEPVAMDVNHSTLGFSVPILGGISAVTGKFMDWTVELDLDPKDFTKSTFRAVIKAESVDTGITQRDAHLRTRAFFSVRDFPEITFESTEIRGAGEGYIIVGDLTIRGNTRSVEIPTTITGIRTNEKSGRSNIAFEGHVVINRDDFEVNYRHDMPFFIGTDVRIDLHILSKSLDFSLDALK